MSYYKNLSMATHTFWGVEIAPGEVKNIPGNVNADFMLRVDAPTEPAPKTDTTDSPEKSKRGRKKKQEPEIASDSPTEPVEEAQENLDLDKNTNDEAE